MVRIRNEHDLETLRQIALLVDSENHRLVVTAPAASKLQPGGRYSVEFGVEVALNKYLDHLPLERQVRMMRREGLEIDSQTLWDQLNVLARHLEPPCTTPWERRSSVRRIEAC